MTMKPDESRTMSSGRRKGQPRTRLSLLRWLAVFSLLGGVIGLAPSGSVVANGQYECNGTLPAGTYDDVRVAEHQSCIFEPGVTIEGNFRAKNPVNIETSGATVHGNVTIDGATGFVVVNSSQVVGGTTHIYGNVTIRNTDQSEIPPEVYGIVYVGGVPLGDEFPAPGEPFLHSTLHIHGNLSMKDNEVFDFYAGELFSKLIVDGNVAVRDNTLSDLDLHVYAMDIGGNLTVKGNTAQAFTSVLCNNVAGNVVISDNFNPGVDPGFGPTPGNVWAQVQVLTNCGDVIRPELPIGNAVVSGNMTVSNNVSGDGNNDFAQIAIFATTVLGDLKLNNNEVDAVAPSADTFITVDGTYVGGNLTCKKNNLDPIEGAFGFGPNTIVGNDECFGGG